MLGSIAFQLSLALRPQKLQPYSWAVKYIWMAWAAAGVVWLIAWLASKKPADVGPAAPTAPSITFAPVITQNANPVVLQNQAAPVPPPTAKPETPKLELEPNFICVGTPTVHLHQQNSFVFSDSTRHLMVQQRSLAVVALIANRPAAGRPGVAPVYGVKAQIICRNAEQEVYSGFGAWVRHFSNMADFPPAQSQQLILVTQNERFPGLVFGMTNPRSYQVPSRPWSATRRVLETSPENEMPVLTDRALDIEVTLLDEGHILGTYIFRYERSDDGGFKVNCATRPST